MGQKWWWFGGYLNHQMGWNSLIVFQTLIPASNFLKEKNKITVKKFVAGVKIQNAHVRFSTNDGPEKIRPSAA